MIDYINNYVHLYFYSWWFFVGTVFGIPLLYFLYMRLQDKHDFGLTAIIGQFGAGKTFFIFLELFILKLRNGNNITIIANQPYSFVDIVYDSKQDFSKLISFLGQYMLDTNEKKYLEHYDSFKPIYLILDEAHYYLFSRGFETNFKGDVGEKFMLILTQCRKRKISFYMITQELSQLDAFVRRLVPYVQKIYNGFGLLRWSIFYYMKKDATDVKDVTIAENVARKFRFSPRFIVMFSQKAKDFTRQRWVSYYIVGFNDILGNLQYNDFFNKIIFPDYWLLKNGESLIKDALDKALNNDDKSIL